MDDAEQTSVLAAELADAWSAASSQPGHRDLDGELDWRRATGWLTEDAHIADALLIELTEAWSAHLSGAAERSSSNGRSLSDRRSWEATLRENPHVLHMLSALVLDDQAPAAAGTGRQSGSRRFLSRVRNGWLRRETSVLWMHVLILVPLLVVFFTLWGGPGHATTATELSVAILKVFAVWVLSFVPSWLYVRFLGQRAGAIWNEYVLHLHRLAVDEPRYLPRPPKSSDFYAEWLGQRGYLEDQERNLYRQKFNAYFGRSVSASEPGTDFIVTTDTMFPVFLCTVVLAASWVAVLWDTGFTEQPTSVWDLLKFGFLGAYAFTVQSLIRRFFQSDLRPSAYAAVILRIIVVFTTLLALSGLIRHLDAGTQAAVAFVVGGFPLVGIYALHRVAAVALRGPVPQLTPPYPLSQIDGLNVWYEARLLEEGIEDMQTLATANLVDVILHTRVPVGRLVDWLDQAHLFLHLDRTEVTRGERKVAQQRSDGEDTDEVAGRAHPDLGASLSSNSRAGTRTRTQLRQLGIRNATDLLKAFPPEQVDALASGTARTGFQQLLPGEVDEGQIRTLVRVLDEDTGLAPIWNWQTRGVRARTAGRQPRSARAESSG